MARLNEVFTLRRASIYTLPGNPADTLKLVLGDMMDGESGPVPCVQIQAFPLDGTTDVWQICDAPIFNTTPTVYIDDVETPAGWTFTASVNHEGKGNVAVLTFTQDMRGRRVSVKCRGMINPDGFVIENWADLIYELMVNQHGLLEEWSTPAYIRLFNLCERYGLIGAGVVSDDIDPVLLCSNILAPLGGAFVGGDGKLNLYIEVLPLLPIPAEIFGEHEADSITWAETSVGIINSLKVFHRKSWTKQVFARAEDTYDGVVEDFDAGSQREFGVREPDVPFQAPWVRSSVVALFIRDTILTLFKRPRKSITLYMTGSKGLTLEQSDPIVFSHRKFPGGSRVGAPGNRRVIRLRRVSIPPHGDKIVLSGYDLGVNYWIDALRWDGTWLLDGSNHCGGNP